jgi:hypothetical protein
VKIKEIKGTFILHFLEVKMFGKVKTPVGPLHEIEISLILKGDNVSRIRDKLTRGDANHV